MITTIDQLHEFLSSIKCEDGNEVIKKLQRNHHAELERYSLSHLGQMNENKNIRASLTLEIKTLNERINEFIGEGSRYYIVGLEHGKNETIETVKNENYLSDEQKEKLILAIESSIHRTPIVKKQIEGYKPSQDIPNENNP